MTKGYHDCAADTLRRLGLLTALGSIDPQDAASLAAVLRKLEALLQGYRAAGDTRPLRVYVAHEHEQKIDELTRKE